MKTPTILVFPLVLTLACVALALGGCGESPGGEAADDSSTAAAAAPAEEVAGEQATLVLGEDTYAFTVAGCGLDAEARAQRLPLLRGRGATDDGERFTVTVERLTVAGRPVEEVQLRIGSISDGTLWQASRSQRPDGGWGRSATGPGGLDALVEVDDRTVRAEGTFVAESGPEAGAEREGRLEATCPPAS